MQMKREKLRNLCLLWLIVLSACGTNIQDDDYTLNKAAKIYLQDDDYTPNKAAKIYLQLGVEYMRRGQHDLALKKLEKSLRLDKNYADAHNAIAVLYERLDINDKARQHYQKAVRLKPKGSDIHNNYGQFLCKHGQWEKADKHFRKALENPLYKTPETPYTNAGLCALRYGNPRQAETYFRQALQKNPKFPRALYHMADLTYKQKRYGQARNYLQRYDKIAKPTPKTLWLGIRIERTLNNREAEANYALLLLRHFPDSEETQLLNQSP
jgi:type IV pilus assembly protein PilF